MNIINKYPKAFQWSFLLLVFFGLCFAIDVPENYKFIRAQAEHTKFDGQTEFNFIGITVRYIEYNFLWRIPPLLGWLPIWVNDSMFFLLNDWLPMEFWDPDVEKYKTRPLILQLTRVISGSILFLIEFIREILIGGIKTIVALTSWDWIDENPWAELPGIPWTIVTAGTVILSNTAFCFSLNLSHGVSIILTAIS